MRQIFLGVAIALTTLTMNATVLDFDVIEDSQSWSEDGLDWGYFGVDADLINNVNSYRGIGHGETMPGNDSRLGTSMNINLQGLYIYTEFAASFSHLVIKGYDEEGNQKEIKTLDPDHYNKEYRFVNLQWKNIASFEVEFDVTNILVPAAVYYDNAMYSLVSDEIAVALTEPTAEEIGTTPLHDVSARKTSKGKGGEIELILFPNPAFGDESKVAIKNMERGEKVVIVKIIDSFGTLISEEKVKTSDVDIKHTLSNLESLVPGPHIVQVTVGARTFHETLMVR